MLLSFLLRRLIMYKIMIVEDEEKIRNILKSEIEKWGYSAYPDENFDDVFKDFAAINPQLVLMDVNLPKFDGFYWCSKIRSISKVPVIFISSRSSNMDIIMAVNMGGDDYITKPFSLDVLMAKINAVLRRTYSYSDTASDAVEYKGMVLSLKDNNLYYNEKKIELTKNEFKILYILMKKGSAIVSRENIMKELWDDENFIDDNTLTVNVNRLRKKMSQIGIEDMIKTVKNQGYMLR